ncbi:HNH endonuclease [Mycolicibacterium psychrotolerans]|nr:HNH endonuclease [Mycolicibacterium psychrotolerans]
MSPRTASSVATDRHHWRSVVRPAALARDRYQCQLRIPGLCVGRATDVDHIVEVADGGSDTLDNAQSCCAPCHRRKTAQHAAKARHR